jgi:hypothetical protein
VLLDGFGEIAMKEGTISGAREVWLAGLLGGLVGGLILVSAWTFLKPNGSSQKQVAREIAMTSASPMLDYVDTLRCPRGLRHVVQVRGFEDGFSRSGNEPSQVEPSLMRFGSFKDAAEGAARVFELRAYDVGGNDKQLIDYFEVPKGTVSGKLIVKHKPTGAGAENDYLNLVPSATFQTKSGGEMLAEFSLAIATAQQAQTTSLNANDRPVREPPQDVLVVPLERFVFGNYGSTNPQIAPILNYLAERKAPSDFITLMVTDDTALDVAALSLCLEPEIKKGVTLVEFSDKPLGPDVSYLACAKDMTQSFCDPYSGDTPCSTALPLACYKEGNNSIPQNFTVSGYSDSSFVGGEVKPSAPVTGNQFKTRIEADAFCASQFGTGWRILSYQDGNGGYVSSRSRIAPKTRLWIDIKDQPRGRCWDRPASMSTRP